MRDTSRVSCSLLACLVVIGSAGLTRTAAARSMADLLALKTPSGLALAPSGREAAYVVSWSDVSSGRVRSELRVVDARPGDARFRVVASGASDPSWSPDGMQLGYLEPGGGVVQVWSRRDDEARRITDSGTDVQSFRWMPDGAGVVYLAESPRTERRALDPLVEGAPRPDLEFRLAALDVAERTVLATGPGILGWDLSPAGDRIVYATNRTGEPDHENRADLYVAPLKDPSPRRLTSRFGPETHPRFSPDGLWVAFQADQDTSVTFSQEEIFIVPAEGGVPRCLTLAYDRPAASPEWRPDGRAIVAETALGHDNAYVAIPIEPGAPHEAIEFPATPFATELVMAGDVLAWIGEGPSAWPDIWARKDGTPPARLTRLNPGVDFTDGPTFETLDWRSPDGTRVSGLLIVPTGGPGPYPMLCYLHGGPYNRSTRRPNGNVTAYHLAARGYLVFLPNFRGSRGFSEAFGQAIRGDLGGGDLADVFSGVDSLVSRGLADPSRLGILGHSYGGFLANLAVTRTDRFRAAASLYGMTSLVNDFLFGESPSYEVEYLGGHYWDLPERYLDRSPLTHVAKIRTPLLLLHGENDRKVTVLHSRGMWTALRALGRTVELVRYPREGHGFREPGHRADAAGRLCDWFDRHLAAPKP